MTIDPALAPVTLRWAVRLLWGQAVAVGLVAAWLVFADLTAEATDLTSALMVTAFAIGVAVALWALGNALSRRRAGARAPAIVLQLMLLPIGWFMIQGGLGWLGVPLIALGVGVTWLLVSPPTTRALGFE
ncbi:hypothetical protein SAMN05443287_103219 [Micromonospora phaseoli]|uniref:Uncharacterized protein n=1 Tax=Micromonospora phaseoli TaxID=1144548 RepID=A0A1H6WKC8_9ACTN|nr:hypothetical protein [Micromonospora phaseoli]PZW01851.1 hypothetical protein CLV64_102218 [Micromonospora phaseoli]GIJ78235.1 hypothetical protein Xph01_26670 [Micromonospora phaseoli]SEJ17388.1 hypothetical protein SAMN05443287_103219 [Micromonospora phaseoli]